MLYAKLIEYIVPVKETSAHTLIFWCLRENETSVETLLLDYDPSFDFHDYTFSINKGGFVEGVILFLNKQAII